MTDEIKKDDPNLVLATWWRDKKEWAHNSIGSSAKKGVWAIWFFTIFWNGISYTPFLSDESILDEMSRKPEVAMVFLFPLVGLGLLIGSIVATRRWMKFGPTPLVLDPFPGSIGGHVGGQLTINTALPSNTRYEVVLSCRRSHITGSGKNRRRSETVKWQSDGVCHHLAGGAQTDLNFRFEVPDNLPESEPDNQESYHLWKVNIRAELEGPDFVREFIIPVFKTAEKATSIKQSTEQHPLTQASAEEGLNSIAQITTIAGGFEAYFPAFQRPGMGIGLTVFGAIFVASGMFANYLGAPLLFPIVFGVVGFLIFVGGIFNLAKSLHVRVNSEGLRARRFLFGYPITTRSLTIAEIKNLEVKNTGSMQSGGKQTVIYNVIAHGPNRQQVIVAERLHSKAEAELIKDTCQTYLNL